MANDFVIFPTNKETEALAYQAAVNAHYAETFEPGGIFAYIRPNADGDWVVPYYGPPWEFQAGTPFEEPAEIEPYRADGVLHTSVVWPDEEA